MTSCSSDMSRDLSRDLSRENCSTDTSHVVKTPVEADHKMSICNTIISTSSPLPSSIHPTATAQHLQELNRTPIAF